MSDESSLRTKILANPTSRVDHENYARYLEQAGNASLAAYVRLFAKILCTDPNGPEFCPLQLSRKKHLDSDPSCFAWDDFLSARHVDNYGPQIVRRSSALGEPLGTHPSPSNEDNVRSLETLLGVDLPIGYRTFLTQISDGSTYDSGMFTLDPVVYSVGQIIEKLSSSELAKQRALSPCEHSWNWMMTKDDRKADETDELVCEEDYGNPPSGFLEIARGAYCIYYLGLSGELRGTIWAVGDYSAPMSLNLVREGIHPASGCDRHVKLLPLDAITVIYELVMERWAEIENLPNIN